jgi:colanic acid/amylovoran biosynthesis glycosyltransferase
MNTVISQAMATGLPVITTRHSGLPEQVADGVTGIVVPEGDVEALANAIVYLIENEHLWPALGRAARARVAELYNARLLADRQVRMYERVAER